MFLTLIMTLVFCITLVLKAPESPIFKQLCLTAIFWIVASLSGNSMIDQTMLALASIMMFDIMSKIHLFDDEHRIKPPGLCTDKTMAITNVPTADSKVMESTSPNDPKLEPKRRASPRF